MDPGAASQWRNRPGIDRVPAPRDFFTFTLVERLATALFAPRPDQRPTIAPRGVLCNDLPGNVQSKIAVPNLVSLDGNWPWLQRVGNLCG